MSVPYKTSTTFEERGILPPPKQSVTVGEADLKYIHLQNEQDPALLQYVRNGGIAFPHIMFPDKLQLGKPARTSLTAAADNGTARNESIFLPTTAKLDSTVFEMVTSHALWLWDVKKNMSLLIGHYQKQGLLLAESWLPTSIASVVLGRFPGTAAAATAEALRKEEADGRRNMLAKIEGPISCLAWHPHRSLVAIAHRDTDTIFLYDLTSDSWCPNVLQNAYMKGISCMKWQPKCGYTLAVGSANGVCLWNITPSGQTIARDASTSLSAGQFSLWMNVLSYPPSGISNDAQPTFHQTAASVSALSFSPGGQWLVVGHQSHGHLTVWDVALETATPLKRAGGTVRSATRYLEMSPNGQYLVSTHASGKLRLWETETWTSRVWSGFSTDISQFAWSPDSRSLFFSVADSADIYALALYKPAPSMEAEIAVVSSFIPHTVSASNNNHEGESVRVGGVIKSLALDPLGKRLVVGFDDNDVDSSAADISLLAVYMVNSDALFRAGGGDSGCLMPLGYIRGPNWGKNEQQPSKKKRVVRVGLPTPSTIAFAPSYKHGALLTVVWANGKVSFVPMMFGVGSCKNMF